MEELNSLLKRLGLEKDEDDAEISERDYESFRSIFQNCIDAIKAKPKPKKKVIRIEFSVENNFSLQKLLDDLDERENKDNSFLLRDLSFHKDKHFHASKLIVDWVIKFGGTFPFYALFSCSNETIIPDYRIPNTGYRYKNMM